ncbi:MAG: phage/plasmid primase, P4 family [Candidatus Cloacimonetes bacterium]|nr:phage/plasmid primase, P4 family [Candidatus Cloacimonadota bacterium]
MFTMYYSDYLINQTNCLYPHKIEIIDSETLKAAVSKDYVCALYKEYYRSVDSFLGSDCLAVDCDNDHSDDPNTWVDIEDIKEVFRDVTFAVHYSRNHLKDKGNKKARPRFHVLFPITFVTDAKKYSELKRKVSEYFPYFDKQALDAGRFFFGTSEAKVAIIKGHINVDDFIEESEFEDAFDNKIIEGNRNSTMSKHAGRIIKKYGDTDEAYTLFLEKSTLCVPPLDGSELELIWRSAKKFYQKIIKDGTYIPPEVYNDDNSYIPGDLSDVGQAEVLAKYFANELRYSPQTHFLRYRGNYWQESEPGAQFIAQELTRRQLKEARLKVLEAYKNASKEKVFEVISVTPKNKQSTAMTEDQKSVLAEYKEAKIYEEFAVKRRSSSNISATLKESHPMLEIDFKELDADPFLLCTPNATYDLKKGISGAREHRPDDFMTKITSYSPSLKGKDEWERSLTKIFGDDELIEYVQRICGLAAIGKVFIEALIIAYGDGGNGKSTFWNAVSRVMGSYCGNLSADTLTVNNRRNIKPEMAELRGKRLIMAAESQEGARLNDSIVKQLCSTDAIFAEKKYKDPFSFIPSHTLVLYTNHLPKVSASDDGIWRRLIVIPFKNKMTGPDDIKNFTEVLLEQSGEYILYWIIEGARKVIADNFIIETPAIVQAAINEYREQNDWFQQFLDECCELDSKARESSLDLYRTYLNFCTQNNEYSRGNSDFIASLEKNGYRRVMMKRKRYHVGLRLKKQHEINGIEDFLT